MKDRIPVVDLFAGPGGLGEGFSAFSVSKGKKADHAFRISISAEMEPTAHQTLRLRAFFRQFDNVEDVPDAYYDYLAGRLDRDTFESDPRFAEQWRRANEEARCLTLGNKSDDKELDRHLSEYLSDGQPWVLIGGPPCQAYSLVGRARNLAIDGYKAEDDPKHYLYREYLRIIKKFKPAVFVMENVKGILSSKIDGELIFQKILSDLMGPVKEKGAGQKVAGYRLFSLTTGKSIGRDDPQEQFHPRDFIVQAENFGIPQRRHRVFVLGVREDFLVEAPPVLSSQTDGAVSLGQVIGDLPQLRSGLSNKGLRDAPEDSYQSWVDCLVTGGEALIDELADKGEDLLRGDKFSQTADAIALTLKKRRAQNQELGRVSEEVGRTAYSQGFGTDMPGPLKKWYIDRRLQVIPNHETRAHIPADLHRYLFSSAWGKEIRTSPKSRDFPDGLAPAHLNWKSGKFTDRFRVQLEHDPATTITSHISKDGHYFIHYDPLQCRSLTVREAARVQTFPDNYFFEGPRTKQYVQVGNAVAPFLANQIATVVWKILKTSI